jgi:hypothetical protein
VVEGLCHGVSKTKSLYALAVGFDYAFVEVRMIGADPFEKGWSKIERDVFVIVENPLYLSILIEKTRVGIRRVAIVEYPFVPVREWFGRRLFWYDVDEGILSWGLIKMTVEDQWCTMFLDNHARILA